MGCIRVWVHMFFPNLPGWGWRWGWGWQRRWRWRTTAPGRAAPSLVTLCHMYLGVQQADITASQGIQEELGQKDNQRDSSVPWGHPAVRSPAVCWMEMGRSALSCAQHVGQCRLHSSTISLPGEGRLFCSANISLLK